MQGGNSKANIAFKDLFRVDSSKKDQMQVRCWSVNVTNILKHMRSCSCCITELAGSFTAALISADD